MRGIKRKARHFWQWVTRGFSDAYLWGLGDNLVEYMYPRLVAFRDRMYMSGDELGRLDQIILSCELAILDDKLCLYTDNLAWNREVLENIEHGMKLLGENILDIWD